MVRRQTEKIIGLIVAALIVALSFVNVDYYHVGVYHDCSLLSRLVYPFFHVSIIHALCNAWCLLSILFLCNVSWRRLLVAYVVAAGVPGVVLAAEPTVGLSTVVFALLGMVSFQAKRKLYFHSSMAVIILPGFLFAGINGWVHLYGYVAGLLVGFLNMPLPCKKK
jgi:membrane associated rhomboid family serine protease